MRFAQAATFFGALLLCRDAGAQSLADAETLPRHSGGLIINPGFGYGPGALERYGRGWQLTRESLVADFDGIDLTKVIGGSEDNANAISALVGKLGTTSFEAKQTAFAVNFTAAYGVTDRLTLAALLPFQHVKYTLDASLTPYVSDPNDPDDFQHSTYRVKNADQLTCPGGDFNITDPTSLIGGENALLEDGGPNYKFNIADLNRALTSDCLGYKAPVDELDTRNGVFHGIGERTYSGFRDLAIAAKYQLYRSRAIHLGLIGYVIAPTGKPDAPDDLFDVKFGDGNWGAALLGAVTIPLGDFTIGASAGYEWEAPDTIEVRLNNVSFSQDLEERLAEGRVTEEQLFQDHLDDGDLIPIVTRYDQVKVERKLGDNIYVYTQFSYQLLEWLSVGLTVNFLHHFRDRVTEIGPRPEGAPAYKTAAQIRAEIEERDRAGEFEKDEDRQAELIAALSESRGRKKAAYGWRTVRGILDVGLGVSFNTVSLFAKGEFPIPLIAGIGINRFIAGQNLDTPEAIQFQLAIPFVTSFDIVDPNEYGYDDEVGGGLPWP